MIGACHSTRGIFLLFTQQGLCECWVVGSMGCMVLKTFMLKSLFSPLKVGSSFKRNHLFFNFGQDLTGELATLIEL